MDFQSAMETFAEAWVAANTGQQTQALALTRSKSPSTMKKERSLSPPPISLSHNLRDTGGGGGGGIGLVGISSSSIRNLHDSLSPSRYIQQMQSPPTPTLSEHHLNTTINNTNQNNHNNNSNNNINNSSNNINNNNNNSNNNNNNNNTINQKNTPNIGGASSSSHSTTPKISTTPTSSIINENGMQSQSASSSIINDKILPSPSMERKDFDFSKANAKSLPLHCIVESVPSLQASLTIDTRNLWKRRPNIETDSYVIIAASTPWSEIVTTALQRLGYSTDIANTARGSLIIKNWKPIPLENISDNPVVPVCDILGELTSVVTLRIVILRTKPSTFAEIKDKLLKLLILQSHAVLRSTGCPLDEVTLSHICRSSYQNTFPFSAEISDDIRRKFDQWWSNQLSPQSPITPKMLPAFITAAASAAPHHQNELDFSSAAAAAAAAHSLQNSRENLLDNHHLHHHHHHHQQQHHQTNSNIIVHPALQAIHTQYPNQKTRMRTSFDPEMELPKLQRWFQENPHPSRQQIQSYVVQLNSLESRRGRKPLDVNNVVYWFKNARAAQKRAEMRVQGIGNGYVNHQANSIMLNHPDYIKGSPSMKSDDIDNMSQHSDDIEDDSSRPSSPQLPLSLTTHERNRSTDSSNVELKEDNSINSMERNNNNTNNSNSNSNNDGCQNGRERNHDIDSNDNIQNSEQRSASPKNSQKSDDDLDMDDNDMSQLDGFRTPSPDQRRDISFPMVPNSMFSHSIMYMSHYMPGIGQAHHPHHASSLTPTGMSSNNLNLSGLSSEERRKRNRTFIDPVTEVPKLEQWFAMNTHPSHNLILKYTEDLNRMPYRQKFPRLESKNVQFWFKNRRAKCKRLKMSLYDQPQCPQLSTLNAFTPKFDTPKFDGPHFDSPKYEDRE